jgi:hypothetical protein
LSDASPFEYILAMISKELRVRMQFESVGHPQTAIRVNQALCGSWHSPPRKQDKVIIVK